MVEFRTLVSESLSLNPSLFLTVCLWMGYLTSLGLGCLIYQRKLMMSTSQSQHEDNMRKGAWYHAWHLVGSVAQCLVRRTEVLSQTLWVRVLACQLVAV